jgi:O-antigen/teichoic acid export membrane protein
MSLLKKLAGETAIYGLSSILSRLVNFVVLASYLTRTFNREENGIITDLYAMAAFLTVIFTYRMETAIFRYGGKEGKLEMAYPTATLSILFSTLLLTGGMILFAVPLANWQKYPNHTEYIVLFALITAFDALAALPFAKLRLDNQAKKYAIFKTLNIVINIFFIFFFLEICPRLAQNPNFAWISSFINKENRLIAYFWANLLASIGTLLFFLKDIWTTRWSFDRDLWKSMLQYALPLVAVSFAAMVCQMIDKTMLKYFLPFSEKENMEQLGIYGAGTRLAMLMSLFTQAYNNAAEPFFFRQANREDAREIYARAAQAFALVGSVVFVAIMLYIDVIQLILGKDFRQGIVVTPVLLAAYWLLGINYNITIWYRLTDKTYIGSIISGISAVVAVVLNMILIPMFGIMGAAWAVLGCYAFMVIAGYLTGQKYYPIPYKIDKIIGYMAFSIAIYISSLWLRPILNTKFLLIVGNTALFLAYLGQIYWWEREDLLKR